MYRVLSRLGAILLLAILAGCSSVRAPVPSLTAFDAAAATFVHAEGRAKVSGQAFIRRNSGKLLRAVGTDVFLIPRTAYADERVMAIYGTANQPRAGVDVPAADPLYEHYVRKTVASSGGSFSFDRVADGEYYVIAMVHIPSDVMFLQVPILERVSVRDGRSVRLVMRGY